MPLYDENTPSKMIFTLKIFVKYRKVFKMKMVSEKVSYQTVYYDHNYIKKCVQVCVAIKMSGKKSTKMLTLFLGSGTIWDFHFFICSFLFLQVFNSDGLFLCDD